MMTFDEWWKTTTLPAEVEDLKIHFEGCWEDAHREGWEQAKREIAEVVDIWWDDDETDDATPIPTILAMEYKHD